MNNHFSTILGCFLGLSLLLTGCWDYKEINDYTIIAGSGVDVATGDKTKITIERLSLSNTQNKKTENVYYVGQNAFDAYNSIMLFSGKSNYSSHATTIVLGEEYAKKGINSLIDMLIRLESSRLSINVVVANDQTAENFLNDKSKNSDISSIEISEMLRNCEKESLSCNPLLFETANTLIGGKQSVCLPILDNVEHLSGNKMTTIVGTAVFAGDKMVAKIDNKQTKIMQLLIGKPQEFTLTVKENNNKFSFILSKIDVKIKPIINNNLSFKITCSANASLSQLNSNITLQPNEVKELEGAISNALTQDITNFFDLCYKDLKLDVLGLSNVLYKTQTKWWQNNQKELSKLFLGIIPTISCDIDLTSTHLLRKSTIH